VYGVGAAEILIILAIVVLLFGPTVVAFFAGYALGQKRGSAPAAPTPPSAGPQPATPSEPPATPETTLPAEGGTESERTHE